MTVLVIVACHFKSKTELCDTTVKRLQAALAKAYGLYGRDLNKHTIFMVGGNVPYEKGSVTLQMLMKQWLTAEGVKKAQIIFNGGTGTFSEARESLKDIARSGAGRTVVVVSSDWWLWSGRKTWKRFAKERNVRVEFLAVWHTGGWRTRLIYLIYAAVVHVSFFLGMSAIVEKRLSAMQEKRLEGFIWNGCA